MAYSNKIWCMSIGFAVSPICFYHLFLKQLKVIEMILIQRRKKYRTHLNFNIYQIINILNNLLIVLKPLHFLALYFWTYLVYKHNKQ